MLPGMTLVVSADLVARRLGLNLPLATADQWTVEQAIGDAQVDVEAYLGRPITPVQFTETGLRPVPGGWPLANDPVTAIVSVTAEVDGNSLPTGAYTVVYTAGLDATNDPALTPILRYVTAAAMNSPELVRMWRTTYPGLARIVKNLSAEGQSVGYEETTPAGTPWPPPVSRSTSAQGPGTFPAGTLPTLKSLDRWRHAGRRIYQRPNSGRWW